MFFSSQILIAEETKRLALARPVFNLNGLLFQLFTSNVPVIFREN